jgi:hypothetical protein
MTASPIGPISTTDNEARARRLLREAESICQFQTGSLSGWLLKQSDRFRVVVEDRQCNGGDWHIWRTWQSKDSPVLTIQTTSRECKGHIQLKSGAFRIKIKGYAPVVVQGREDDPRVAQLLMFAGQGQAPDGPGDAAAGKYVEENFTDQDLERLRGLGRNSNDDDDETELNEADFARLRGDVALHHANHFWQARP